MDEYYVSLALLSLRMMDWKSETLDARRLAFLVSALSVAEAQRWRETEHSTQWPDATTDMDRTEIRTEIRDD